MSISLKILSILILFLSCKISYSQNDNSINDTIQSFEEFFQTSEEDTQNPSFKDKSDRDLQKASITQDLQTHETESYNKVQIITLNKITAKSKNLTINVSDHEYFGNIEITMHQCIKKIDPYAPDNMALLTIVEKKLDDDPVLLFQGWMFSSSIALSNFAHPVYEIFIKDCF